MEKKLHTFFQSGLLDKYILDETSASERLKVEHFIDTYPEVESEYKRLQDNLEIIAKASAVEAPESILDAILDDIEDNTTPVIQLVNKQRKTPWYSIAASVVALLFAGGYYLKTQQNLDLLKENQVVVEEIFDLRSDIEENNKRLDNLMHEFMKLNNPETEKYVFRGNDRAKDLKTVAYINPVDETSMIDVVSLPQLPEDQTYQLWAEMQDRMINLGILDASQRQLQSVPYVKDALALSITIQDKDRLNRTEADSAVAEIDLNNKRNN
ncbi:anti-sigma factor [Psychroserpens mesophilus]|uniref:anti-sigma factor n=1 Tax=Psychroserpens mesophilus TaxID=325473 RepID=UPI00058C03FA|nr:anti-sigma factor [Psychroserpens mesophilus]